MKSVYVLAEADVNHNGDFEIGRKLSDEAKAPQADAVKFQTFRIKKILRRSAEWKSSDYINRDAGECA